MIFHITNIIEEGRIISANQGRTVVQFGPTPDRHSI